MENDNMFYGYKSRSKIERKLNFQLNSVLIVKYCSYSNCNFPLLSTKTINKRGTHDTRIVSFLEAVI